VKGQQRVYVTVVCEPAGRTVVHGPAPTADPAALHTHGRLICTTPLCPTSGVDRSTGRGTDPSHIMHVDRTLATAIASARPAADLGGPLVTVLVHPDIRLLVAVSPFESSEAIDKWWHWHANRFSTADVVCLPAAFTHLYRRKRRMPMTIDTAPGHPRLRVAFYGRVAHDSDHTLTQQYEQCRRALPSGTIAAVFYDVGPSGKRGTPTFDRLTVGGVHARRDSELDDLLAEAIHRERRFDYLTASDPFRLSRNPSQAIQLLRRLRSVRIQPLFPHVADTGHPADLLDLNLSLVSGADHARITECLAGRSRPPVGQARRRPRRAADHPGDLTEAGTTTP
jgi:hypothetical protein